MTSWLLWFVLLRSAQVILSHQVCEWNTCHKCISDPKLCVWCSSTKFELGNRCRPAFLANEKAWCDLSDIQNPQSIVTAVDTKDFSSTLGHTIQLKPQKYHLDLRVGEPRTFNFSYKAADNFPVDIYFLLDVSLSTKHFRNDLLNQSKEIFSAMKNLTTDVYMGLGTFIDKNMIPMNNLIKQRTAYSFQHQLNLTDNITAFDTTLNGITFGENIDPPESGLDGIMQVIACKDRIKWREQSRKILIHMTDQSYHSAGDGKLAGIVEPYDGKCYMDNEGFYSKEKEMDYPSVGIINKKATDEQITILFLSSLSDNTVYFDLQSAVAGSYSERYEAETVISVLKEIYEGITQTINLSVNMTSQQAKHFNITFEPNCQLTNRGSACSVEKGEEKQFMGTITVSKYFGMKKIYLGINQKGLKENVSLDINVITDCGCDIEMEKNSSRCNYAGNWSCGVCECFKDKYGPTCNCSNTSSECRSNGTEIECSGHGRCICGVCDCDQGYGGKICEVRTNNCQRDRRGALCSDQGICRDGICTCHSGWTGESCDCTESNAACMQNNKECNNRGHCQCGECACSDLPKWDVREYQDEYCSQTPCTNCHNRQCRKLIPCEECLHNGDKCEEQCGVNIMIMEHDIPEELKSNWNICSNVRVNFGCYANYAYIYNDNHTITMFMLHERNCKENHILIGVISLVVLIIVGVMTLVAWKLLTDARDRREYEQFRKALQASEYEEVNLTYKAPTTTYKNPAFQSEPNAEMND